MATTLQQHLLLWLLAIYDEPVEWDTWKIQK